MRLESSYYYLDRSAALSRISVFKSDGILQNLNLNNSTLADRLIKVFALPLVRLGFARP